MKKFLVFYTQLESAKTGGQVIDFDFIHQIESSKLFDVTYFLDSDMKSTSNIAYNIYLLTHVMRFFKYDVIFMNSRTYPRMLFFVMLLRLFSFKGKLITYHHHYNYKTSCGWRKYIHKVTELTFLRCMSEILIPSPYVLDLTKKLIPDIKTVFIPIGFNKIGNICDFGLKKERIVCVGNIDRRKRTHHIVEIANLLKDKISNLRYDIVGGVLDQKYSLEIQKQIERYHLKDVVILHGRVSNEKLSSIYKNALLFVFPSSYEGYGMVLVEAMNFGVPVVAYNNSAIPYTISNGYNGILVDDGDYEKMADLIEKIIKEGDLAALSYNAYSYAKKMPDISDMRHKMADYIRELS